MEKKRVLECYLIKIFKVIWETFLKTNLMEKEKLYLKMKILIKEWKDNQLNGQGNYSFQNGNKYEG